MDEVVLQGPDHKIGLYSVAELSLELKGLGKKKFCKEHPHPYLLLIADSPDGDNGFLPFQTISVNDPSDFGMGPETGLKEVRKGAYVYLGTAGDVKAIGPNTANGLGDGLVFAIANSSRNTYDWMVTVGRAANNDVVIRHRSVSKMHAYFRKEEGRWEIEDPGSTNGTKINRSRIGKGTPQSVRSQDIVAFGSVTFIFFESEDFCSLLSESA